MCILENLKEQHNAIEQFVLQPFHGLGWYLFSIERVTSSARTFPLTRVTSMIRYVHVLVDVILLHC